MKSPVLIILTLSAFFAIQSPNATAQTIGSGAGWSIKGTDPIQIFYGDKHVTSYEAGVEEGKPFFYPIIGPTDENMTRHWPMKEGFEDEDADHIHHRGMWYGLGNVNGLDFWHFPLDEKKQDKNFGSIRHMGMKGVTMSKDDITFNTKSEWLAFDDETQRILSDRREFRLFYDGNGSLVIDLKLTLVADAGDVTINDDKEGAWSIRTIPTLRLEGEHAKGHIINNEGIEGKAAWGKRAKWVDYYGVDRAGNEVGIAIFDHPSNFRHPTWWHARHYGLFTANPFGQGNFEKEAPKEAGKHVLKNGEELTFRYRTLFHKGSPEDAGIATAYEAFIKK
ncbi:MAG: PmoA family protein [Verrucomicrobiales bacterium]|nr:PmoA family protein [Verrucomicrobiales bacterium]